MKKISKLIINNARSKEQVKRMKLAEEIKVCPFCPDGLRKIHRKKILYKNSSWFLTESAFPYEGTDQHYLLIPIKHLTNTKEITKKSWQDFGEIFNHTVTKKKIHGGGMFLRFGEMEKNGSSVEHLHVQIISGNSSEHEHEEKRESIKIKLGYKKK